MINLRIVTVGREKDAWVSEACSHFEKLLRRYARIDWVRIPAVRGKGLSPEEIKRVEAQRLRSKIQDAYVVALADSGRQFDSEGLARWLERTMARQNRPVVFVLGGPHGLDDSILQSADTVLSFSKLTFSHRLMKPLLLEQLYRTFSILAGTDYHK